VRPDPDDTFPSLRSPVEVVAEVDHDKAVEQAADLRRRIATLRGVWRTSDWS
jgi:hypothetical protein